MAYAIGSDVIPITYFDGLGGGRATQNQPIGGVCLTAETGVPLTVNVLWDDGSVVTGVAVTALVRIAPPDPDTFALIGRVVNTVPGGGAGSRLRGVVVQTFASAEGIAVAQWVVVRTDTGYITTAVPNITVIQNQ